MIYFQIFMNFGYRSLKNSNSIRPKQPTDPIHFCVRVTKFPFYISFRSFRPDYLSIFNGRGVVSP